MFVLQRQHVLHTVHLQLSFFNAKQNITIHPGKRVLTKRMLTVLFFRQYQGFAVWCVVAHLRWWWGLQDATLFFLHSQTCYFGGRIAMIKHLAFVCSSFSQLVSRVLHVCTFPTIVLLMISFVFLVHTTTIRMECVRNIDYCCPE